MTDETSDPQQGADDPEAPTTGPVLDAEDNDFVSGLLARSGADIPAVPAEIAAQWDAAIVAEAAARSSQAATAAGMIVPMQRTPSRRPRGVRFAGIAASVAAIALVGGVVANALVPSSSEPEITTASDTLPTTDEVTTSGSTFSDDAVPAQANTLVTKAASGSTQVGAAGVPATLTASPIAPSVAPTPVPGDGESKDVTDEPAVADFMADEARRDACIENLAQQEGAKPIAVDMGYYKGKPAAMVVLPAPDDPEKVDVFIVGPECNIVDADVRYFTRVPVPN